VSETLDSYRASACDAEHGCITCGDVATAVRVLALDASDGMAVCVNAAGSPARVEVELVGPVAVGDALLVHAGVALTRLERQAAAR
jgi:hydrogenase maturation factor